MTSKRESKRERRENERQATTVHGHDLHELVHALRAKAVAAEERGDLFLGSHVKLHHRVEVRGHLARRDPDLRSSRTIPAPGIVS